MEKQLLNFSEQIIPWIINHGIRIGVILLLAFLVQKFLQKFIRKAIQLTLVVDPSATSEGEIKRRETLVSIFTTTAQIVVLILTILMVLQELGVMIGPILAGAGIVGLAVGFGGQYLIRDIISGLFIIIENQYRIGDVVSIGDASGLVESITLRMTTLRDMNGTVHHIPHGEIKKVSNSSKYFARVNLNIGISYNTKLEHVIEVINTVCNQMAEEEYWKELIIKTPQFLRVEDFADSAVIVKILGETQPLKQWEVTGELRKRLKIAFDNEGIEIPFPQMVVHKG